MTRLTCPECTSRAPKPIMSRNIMCTYNYSLKVISTNFTVKKFRGSKPQLYLVIIGLNFFLETYFCLGVQTTQPHSEICSQTPDYSNDALGVLFFLWAFPSFTFPPRPGDQCTLTNEVKVVGPGTLVLAFIVINEMQFSQPGLQKLTLVFMASTLHS